MSYFFRKIAHFLSSNSRHGTHSPFVYTLTDELIYNTNISRSVSLMDDIQDYYIQKWNKRKDDFLVTSLNENSLEDIAVLQDRCFMIFIEKIYHKDALKQWQAMQSDKRFVVLIDLFEFGIVCKRTEQPKETFKLRYPYHLY